MQTIQLYINYWTIVRSERLCDELWINERCVAEWIVDSSDTYHVEITNENKWILQVLSNLIEE